MPFSQVKNKWISGLTFEAGNWFCNVDGRANAAVPAAANNFVDNGCGAFSIRDHGDGGRQVLIQTGDLGKGWVFARGAGIRYQVGPNTLRLAYTTESAADDGGTRARKRSKGWLIGDDLFLWSPKGFLTGSATAPGSILVGTHFERANLDIDCSNRPGGGRILCSDTGIPSTGASGTITQYHRNTVLLREWDLWYFIAPRMSVGTNILWYNATNLGNQVGQAGYNLGLCSKTNVGNNTNCRPGEGGNWVDVFFNWRYTF
jgi:hypothetical protein